MTWYHGLSDNLSATCTKHVESGGLALLDFLDSKNK
jgi:hypothetical protein